MVCETRSTRNGGRAEQDRSPVDGAGTGPGGSRLARSGRADRLARRANADRATCGSGDRIVIAIANGTHRIDRGLLADVAGFDSLKLAPPELVFELNGYPAGGVSPIGIRESEAPIVIDPAVLDEEIVYGGAGTEDDLIEIKSADLLRVTQATVRQITRRE
jgi:prolyl-tRNA editing enzyme YbaK/EbsC (Cys-tRNA(Pro) deacylase)